VVQPTILVVEDHAPARFLRTRILERAGYGTSEADSAAGAIARAGDASLLLLDIGLPDSDGFAVCEHVKKTSPELPVVMITSIYRSAQARRDAFAVGADAFLLEPIQPERLVRTVERLMQGESTQSNPLESETWIVTDSVGVIEDLSPQGARLLNLSERGARGRSLTSFFAENRPTLMDGLRRAVEGVIVEQSASIQPRDRRPVPVHVDVSALPHAHGEGVRILWAFSTNPG
jgi:CheY-like chemotaxis protein